MKRVAAGENDFCLTSVHHYLTARSQEGDLACRFIAVVVQQSPLAAIVAEGSPLRQPADLAGARIGSGPDSPFTAELLWTLEQLGVAPPQIVPMGNDESWEALATGDIDAVVDLVDGLPRVRRKTGVAVRPVPTSLEVYASGLVAGEHVPLDTARQMRAAVARALEAQRDDPETGMAELRRRYAEADEDDAREGWRLLEPYIFNGAAPGSMDAARWEQTLSHLCAARGLSRPDPETVYQPKLAGVAQPG